MAILQYLSCKFIEEKTMDFNKRFKTYSNTELLRIIDNPNEYQPNAVETAKTLLSDRQLTEEEINLAKSELDIEKQDNLIKEQKKRAIEDKVKNFGRIVLDNVTPIQKESPTTEKIINVLSLLLGGLSLFQLYNERELIGFMFTDSYAEWDFSMVLYFFPLVVLPVSTILFFKRKKTGWILLAVFLTYNAMTVFGFFILTIDKQQSDFLLYGMVFRTTFILFFLVIAGTIGLISRENIRTVYSISTQTMVLTISISALIVGIGMVIFFYL